MCLMDDPSLEIGGMNEKIWTKEFGKGDFRGTFGLIVHIYVYRGVRLKEFSDM